MGSFRHLTRQAGALALLLPLVSVLHLAAANWLGEQAVQWGEGAADRGPTRLAAVFSVELRPVAPPAVAPVVAPAVAAPAAVRTPVAAVARAASAAADAASASSSLTAAPDADPDGADTRATVTTSLTTTSTGAPAVEPAPVTAASAATAAPGLAPADTAVPASAAAPPLVASAAAPAFEWPRSTRLTYRLTGYYRGPVEGQAQVQWLREGTRYQVHLDVGVGPSFAPLVSRRMTSDGDIGPQGLQPRRYDEETKVALRDARRLTMHFDGQRVRLANGSEVAQPAGVQDTASQFVQLTWLFTTRPDLLQPGQSVPLMLALPRRVDDWVYDVVGAEPLHTPAGEIEAVHVRPRRPARAGDLTAEMWVAPSLQYLPVRFIIRQDAETYVDLLLDRLPQQAADAATVPR